MPKKSCPHCHVALERARLKNVEVDVCRSCRGLWFDEHELDQVVRQSDPSYTSVKNFALSLGSRRDVTRFDCPACANKLVAYALGQGDPLLADVCEVCMGVWLDAGELVHAKVLPQLATAVAEVERERTRGDWLFQFFTSLPVEFNMRPRRTPVATYTIIALSFLVFAMEMWAPNTSMFVRDWGLGTLRPFSAHWAATVFSHQFFHGGVLHLVVNMYFLWVVGDNVEDALGPWPYLGFFLFCGIVAGVTQTALMPSAEVLIGASGAIAGVMAAYAVIFRRAKLTFMILFFQRKLSVAWYFLFWILFNVLGAMLGGTRVAYLAHIGGFVCGLVIALLFRERILEKNPLIRYLNLALAPRNA